jgi:aminopeptidase-like protein
LVAGDLIIPGEIEDEIFLTTYLCHPSLAVNELSGPLVLAGVYNRLKDLKLKHTLRFYVGPENIGAVAYLSRFGEELKRNVVAGLVITCVGLGPEYTYKKSRTASITDIAALNVLKPKIPIVKEFFPDGSCERQWCSPGYNLPVGVFMRRGYWAYKEYHTSLDNKELISFDTIMESIDTIVDIVLTTVLITKAQYNMVLQCLPSVLKIFMTLQ